MLALGLWGAFPAIAVETCRHYAHNSTVPENKTSLSAVLRGGMATRGNIAYWIDNGRLEVTDMSDPLTFNPVPYEPVVHIDPAPDRLIKISETHLYAINTDGTHVIDITVPESPRLLGMIPTVAPGGTFLGSTKGHAFFLNWEKEIAAYDVSDPLNPTLSAVWPPDLSTPDEIKYAAALLGHIYIFTSFEMLVYDVSVPESPQFARRHQRHESGWQWLLGIGPEGLASEERLFVSKPRWRQSSTTQVVTLEDAADPVTGAELARRARAAGGGIVYSQYFNPDIRIYEFAVETVSGTELVKQDMTSVDFFSRRGEHVLTDRALLIAEVDSPSIVTIPRQCDPPEIIPGSVEVKRAPDGTGGEFWTFTWETAEYADPALDGVVIRDSPRSPAVCQRGTVGLSGHGSVGRISAGRWKHTITYRHKNCIPNCEYRFDVESEHTGIGAQSDNNRLRVAWCLGGK